MATLMLSRLPRSRQWSRSASHTAPMSQGRGGGGGRPSDSEGLKLGSLSSLGDVPEYESLGARPFFSKSVTLLTTCGRTAGTEPQRVEEVREWEGVGGVGIRGGAGELRGERGASCDDITSQMPSHAKMTNSSAAASRSKALISGKAVTACRSAGCVSHLRRMARCTVRCSTWCMVWCIA